jgi:hypothetical protein
MKWWLGVAVGLVAVTILAGAVSAEDHTGDTVRVSAWADDVCGSTAAWEGQLEAIGDAVRQSGAGLRQHDGGSGDDVTLTFFVRAAITRAIQATDLTLQEGLKRAGIPDVDDGERASLVMREWATRTLDNLRSARATLEREPGSQTAALEALGYAVGVLRQSQLEGRAAFEEVAAIDAELEQALEESDVCTELRREEP